MASRDGHLRNVVYFRLLALIECNGLNFSTDEYLFQVDATQRLLLEELPPVLVLQLKWFIYDKNGGLQKYVKQVDFDVDLEIGKGQKNSLCTVA
jgi:hypothetical protein